MCGRKSISISRRRIQNKDVLKEKEEEKDDNGDVLDEDEDNVKKEDNNEVRKWKIIQIKRKTDEKRPEPTKKRLVG